MDLDALHIESRESISREDRGRGLTIPYMMNDFKAAIRHSQEKKLPRRVFSVSENPDLQCAIDIDFSGHSLNAQVQYLTKTLPRQSYEMICTLTDLDDYRPSSCTAGNRKSLTLCHEFHYQNLWLTVVGDWQTLCTFSSILPRKELYEYIENDFRFLLMFKFLERDSIELETTVTILSSLFENETFTDFKIIAKNREFRVHKAILATASPVFQAMLTSQMKEQQENKMLIDDIEPDVIKEMLRFIYTGTIQNLVEYAGKLLIAADKYRLESLKNFCSRQLSDSLCIDNVMDILVMSDTHHEIKLKQLALNFINRNLKAVLKKDRNLDILSNRPEFALEILLNVA